MTLKELCGKIDTTLREYQVPARKGTEAWASEIRNVSVNNHGFIMNVVGVGTTRKIARESLVSQLRGKTISISKDPQCGHSAPCSHILSMTVPTNLTA